MKITNRVVENYLDCEYKAYLETDGATRVPHDYETLMIELANEYGPKAREMLLKRSNGEATTIIAGITIDDLKEGHAIVFDGNVEMDNFEFQIDALKRVEGKSLLGSFYYIPVLFYHSQSVKEKQKMLLACAGHVIGQLQGTQPETGLIVFGDSYRTTTIRIQNFSRKVGQVLAACVTLQNSPPSLFLNRHCPACEFRNACRQQAIADDSLSLLRGMTKTKAAKLRAKGTFTVFQLSHTYRHRRRSKRHKHLENPHSFALQALAIREKKIHVVGLPDLSDCPVHIYVDVEGDSNARSVYLIGVLVKSKTEEKAYSFWAKSKQYEIAIFNQLLSLISHCHRFSIFHYGNYETEYFKRMREHATDQRLADLLIDRSCNILSVIYSNIYFPTYSNSLKDIGEYLGCRWSDENASGLQSLVWRHDWQATNDDELKERLTRYNYEDCVALRRVIETIYRISDERDQSNKQRSQDDSENDIFWVQEASPFPANREWRNTKFEIAEYDEINKAAYFDYQRERVYFRTNPRLRHLSNKKRQKRTRKHRANKRVEITMRKCRLCGSVDLAKVRGKEFTKSTYDLTLTSSGIVRKVTEYYATRVRCRTCKRSYMPPKFRRVDPFRHSLKAWTMYQHVSHHTSFPRLRTMLWEFFGINVAQDYVHMMKALLAKFYRSTYKRTLERLLSGTLIHADETEFKLKAERGYVWVLTNMEEVYYFYRPSREGAFLTEMLNGFQGVLVTDFYGVYDALPCQQQKCLIHLIRDFNDELVKHPFDEELKEIASGFGCLLRRTIETVDRRGLRQRWLRKHERDVDRFFRGLSRTAYKGAAAAVKKKLIKYKNKLFEFIKHDGVPWNNNNAEHAVKRFARFRTLADGLMSETGIADYLVLLSIFVTCEFKGVNVLRFLMSRERDIDVFACRRSRARRNSTVEVYPAGFPDRYGRKDLTKKDDLRAIADREGLGELFDHVAQKLGKQFNGSQSSGDKLVFLGLNGKSQRRRIFYLVPHDSDLGSGLRYNVYTKRLADFACVTISQARALLPSYKNLGEGRGGAGEFGTGFISDESDILKLVQHLADRPTKRTVTSHEQTVT